MMSAVLSFVVGVFCFHSLAEECPKALAPVHRFTPSPEFLSGLEDAEAIVAERAAGNHQADAIWWAFKEDPRFPKGLKLDSPDPLDWAKTYANLQALGKDDNGYSLYPTRSSYVRWGLVGLRAMNMLLDMDVDCYALVETGTNIDGQTRNTREVLKHDEVHACDAYGLANGSYAFEVMIGKKLTKKHHEFGRQLHQNFRYATETASLSPDEHLLFDFGYYLFFHEALVSYKLNDEFYKIRNRATSYRLSRAYRRGFSSWFWGRDLKFEFSEDHQLIKVELYDEISLPYRFLNPKDQRPVLPLEIEAEIQAHPDKGLQIVKDFLNEALTVFFKRRYAATARFLLRDRNLKP
jgi:hypothetical protein